MCVLFLVFVFVSVEKEAGGPALVTTLLGIFKIRYHFYCNTVLLFADVNHFFMASALISCTLRGSPHLEKAYTAPLRLESRSRIYDYFPPVFDLCNITYLPPTTTASSNVFPASELEPGDMS